MAAFLIALGILALMERRLLSVPFDQPNTRSLHTKPVPRGGGIAIWLGWLATLWWQPIDQAWLIPLLLLIAISYLEDRRGLTVHLRLVLHILAAVWLTWFVTMGQNLVMQLAIALALVWMLNLYNFMDGSDGLAGGMTLFGFSAYALAAFLEGDRDFALLNLCLVFSGLAFLLYNFHPARIFMGDTGSVPIGFLAGAFGLIGWHKGLWSYLFPILVFLPFIADATITLFRRLLKGEKIWRPHRDHYYQRLVQLGYGHRGTAYIYYVLMLATGATAVATHRSVALTSLGVWLAILAVLYLVVDRRWKHEV